MRSYSSATRGSVRRLREALSLYRIRTSNSAETVKQLVKEAEGFEKIVVSLSGKAVKGRSILEVGPGHFLIQACYFARSNDVTAIDMDVIPVGIDPLVYISMLFHNGLQRSAKTILRKALGVDVRHRRYLRKQLRIPSLPSIRVVHGDVCQMNFPCCSFDIVLCRSVLHHIVKPSVALAEMARVLRPGGIAVANFHLYTSHNGSLDPRVMSTDYPDSLLWGHLRSSTAEDFRGNSFLNKMRLDSWRALLRRSWPGCTIECEKSSRCGIEQSAQKMISSGSISGYTLEELTTHTILAFWQKPFNVYESI